MTPEDTLRLCPRLPRNGPGGRLFYANDREFLDLPALQPGDAIVFNDVHGARGNTGNSRRQAFSARFLQRPGQTSGQRLREDWFPVVWSRPE